ncbi:hypothetical protein POF45_06475 [Pseudomonas sp. 681]|uniref:Uncharacterized protein n=2 Tax=Pseudomonas TaxID=286 RepID=A0ABT6QJL9_9PSED|nr:hypothetical protein [Pseudomonas sp. 681]MDI2591078.1 hypothetical protein [Pseudomonas sp. 681]
MSPKKNIICLSLLDLLAAGQVFAQPPKPIINCLLSDGTQASLLAESSADGQRLFVNIDKKTQPAFTDMPDADFVGEVVMARCAGSSLIFALDYGSPYLKGVVLRKNPVSHSIERIDFAEKALPTFLYLGQTQMRLVFPNIGNETPKRFLIYDYVSGKGQGEEASGSDIVPGKSGFEVIDLKPAQ